MYVPNTTLQLTPHFFLEKDAISFSRSQNSITSQVCLSTSKNRASRSNTTSKSKKVGLGPFKQKIPPQLSSTLFFFSSRRVSVVHITCTYGPFLTAACTKSYVPK